MTNPFEHGPAAAAPPAPVAPAPAAQARPASASNGGFGGVDTKKSDDPYSVSVPTGVSGIRMNQEGILDQLLLVEPVEYIPSMITSANPGKPTDAFRVNILPLDGVLAEQLQEDVLVFQDALKRELKKTYHGSNKWLFAYLTLGNAKTGRNAPYLFIEPNEEQQKIFERFKARQQAAC